MTNKKVATLLAVMFLSLMVVSATESRVKALIGTSDEPFVVDSWCEPFELSPSLAYLYRDNFFWVEDGIKRALASRLYEDRVAGGRGKTMSPVDRGSLEYSGFISDTTDYEIAMSRIGFYLGRGLPFAWRLSDGLFFGLKVDADSAIIDKYWDYDKWGSKEYLLIPRQQSRREVGDNISFYSLNFKIRHTPGLTIHRKRFTTTFALPSSFAINEHHLEDYRDFEDRLIYDLGDIYSFKLAFRNLTDFRVGASSKLRLNGQLSLACATQKELSFIDSSVVAEATAFGAKLSMTMNHWPGNREHLIFYGFKFTSDYMEEASVNYDFYGEIYFNSSSLGCLALDSYVGAELKPHDKIYILFGVLFRNLRFITQDYLGMSTAGWVLQPEDIRDKTQWNNGLYLDVPVQNSPVIQGVLFPFDCDLNMGLAVKPIDGFTIELNANLYRLTLFGFRDFSFEIGFILNMSKSKLRQADRMLGKSI